MPRKNIRNSITWTPSDIQAVSARVLAGTSSIDSDIEAILAELDVADETARLVATAAVLDAIAEVCRERAEASVCLARESGATWNEVAIGTGYSSPGSAAQRFDAGHRERQREASWRRDEKRRRILAAA